ncbi:MAG: hypothetical protein J6J21_01420 [Clostridia bacterium]|nr:hypothetical protein [Clostridia bacterium]
MKNFKKLLALALVVMMLSAMFCVGVNAAIDPGTLKGKITVSHFNQSDVYSNATAIFTKEFMGDKSLAQIADEYILTVNDKMMSVDPDWAGKYSNSLFTSSYGMVCTWNEDNGRYEVAVAVTFGPTRELTCPDNSFIVVMHHDDDTDGRHKYPSNAFADLNFGDYLTSSPEIQNAWKALVGQPVYLYNIDLDKTEAGSGVKTTGTFDSKISVAGLDNGMREVYNNFSSESYLYFGDEDPDATVDYFEPKNITVSFKPVEDLKNAFGKLDMYEYSADSWAAVESLFEEFEAAKDSIKTNKEVKEWKDKIAAAKDALVPADEAVEDDTGNSNEGEQGQVQIGDKKPAAEGGDNTLLFVLIGVGVLVVAGVIFLVVASKKGKKPAEATEEAPAEEPKEEAAAEEKAEEEKTEE